MNALVFWMLVPGLQPASGLFFSYPLMMSPQHASRLFGIAFFVAHSLVCCPLCPFRDILPAVIEFHILKYQFPEKCWLVNLLARVE
jgi:hypothetical protein